MSAGVALRVARAAGVPVEEICPEPSPSPGSAPTAVEDDAMRRTWQGSGMASGPKKERARGDVNTLAFDIMRQATGDTDDVVPEVQAKTDPAKDPAAVELGRRGGRRGGRARAERMTPEQRSEAARVAASARWKKSD